MPRQYSGCAQCSAPQEPGLDANAKAQPPPDTPLVTQLTKAKCQTLRYHTGCARYVAQERAADNWRPRAGLRDSYCKVQHSLCRHTYYNCTVSCHTPYQGLCITAVAHSSPPTRWGCRTAPCAEAQSARPCPSQEPPPCAWLHARGPCRAGCRASLLCQSGCACAQAAAALAVLCHKGWLVVLLERASQLEHASPYENS